MDTPKKHPIIYLIFFSLLTALIVLSCSQSQTDLIPREVLFGNPEKSSPRISPDGQKLAYLAPYNDVLNVWVRTIGQEDDRVVTPDTNRGIRRYFWAEDSKHILYLQDVGGNENWRLYGVNLESGEIKDYTPFDNVQVRILDTHKVYPEQVLIAMNKENPVLHDVYRLDLDSGELTLIAKNPGNVVSWMTDAGFRLRAAVATNPEGGMDLLIRESETSPWEKILTWSEEDNFSSGPISFTKDGQSLYLIDSRNANTGRLVKMELKTKSIKVIAEDPNYDVSGVMIHPDTYEIQAYSFTRARREWFVIDDTIRRDFQNILNLEYGDFQVYDRDNSDNIWLVGFTRDNAPVTYYAYDRSKKEGIFLFDQRPQLKKYQLAKMMPISFVSRDGLPIHGYITFPPGQKRERLPMVLFVHGGPYARDTWGYDPEAQWLANRGYICLQVNFRGSTGYGKKFLNAGNKEWGGKMHNDLVDAVKWAIEKGYADSQRVAIYGGSYGGYAALVGATFTPELFRCAIDVVGPSNLITWITSVPPYWKPLLEILYKRVGHPETEEEFLKSRSPLFKVDQIKIPILIAQGANDPRVPKAESDQIVEALKAKGVDYQYLVFEDEGHGFAKPENRLKFYTAAEKFLAKHLGGRYQK
ncbi:MAG: S9 family peptidase [Calditrichia bacterium]